MSKPRDMNGIWRGFIFYDMEEIQQFYSNGVEFELNLTQAPWQKLFRRFSGTSYNKSDRGIPDDGDVWGRCHGETIFFTEFMPNFYVASGAEIILLEDYLPQFGYGTRTGLPHPPC
jgi:hypothetical protein